MKDIKIIRISHKLGDILFNIYKIVSILGQGGSSTVYKVQNIKSLDFFVCKEMDIVFINNNYVRDKYLDNFYKEYEILLKLQHPNINKVFLLKQEVNQKIKIKEKDIFIEKRVYLFSSFFLSKTLDDLIKQNYLFSKDEFIFLFEKLFKVLIFIHKNGYIHGDIKPSNILIDLNKKKFKLIDFGLAREFEKEERFLTPFYHPKDVFKGYAIDIYSLLKILLVVNLKDRKLSVLKDKFYKTYIKLYKNINLDKLYLEFKKLFFNKLYFKNFDIKEKNIIKQNYIFENVDIDFKNNIIFVDQEFNDSNVYLKSCIVLDTLYFRNCKVYIDNCYFLSRENALFLYNSEVNIKKSRFRDSNIAVISYKSDLTIFDCLFIKNNIAISYDKDSKIVKDKVSYYLNIDNDFIY